ncbi:PREDICTED: uncharacterized protein LOC104808429 [Tarenaya hassleriana]|uniref:uncharacterized protein LOC104808429 n=1 Tax=Tarenaya hassleriana TaxID=28532 RepID=UPI00053C252D|nr:PREDICTED: uncharacterized protein LOC104808429 [Tarenaya hassleriana]
MSTKRANIESSESAMLQMLQQIQDRPTRLEQETRPIESARAPNHRPYHELRADPKFKSSIFTGKKDPEEYLEWERQMDAIFEYYSLSNRRKIQYAASQLAKDALTWWEREESNRRRAHYDPVSTWKEMKILMRKRDQDHLARECPNQREIIIEDDGESKSIVEDVVNLEETYEVMSKKEIEYVNEEKEEPVEDPDLMIKEVPKSAANANGEMHGVKKEAFEAKKIIEDSNNTKVMEINEEADKSENVIVGESLNEVKRDIGMIRLDWFEQIKVTSKKENHGFKVVSKPSAMTNDRNFILKYVMNLEQQMQTFQTDYLYKVLKGCTYYTNEVVFLDLVNCSQGQSSSTPDPRLDLILQKLESFDTRLSAVEALGTRLTSLEESIEDQMGTLEATLTASIESSQREIIRTVERIIDGEDSDAGGSAQGSETKGSSASGANKGSKRTTP